MPAAEEVIQKLDECINAAKAVFEQEYERMALARTSREGPIGFSSTKQLTQQCLNCGRAVVDYAIFGRWVEGTQEGEANVSWKCSTCQNRFVFRGSRSTVIRQIVYLSNRPKKAA